MGSTFNSMEMPQLFFSEEADLKIHTDNSWLYLFIVAKGCFFIAALICQLIIFSYKSQPWLYVTHSVSYHDSCR